MPRCRHCKDKFTSRYFMQRFCMYKDECIKAHVEFVKEANQKADDKKWSKIKQEMIEANMTISDWYKKLEEPINQIIRLIDYSHTCMMCGNDIKKTFACHFHSVGSSPAVRFHLLNEWTGCFSCNNMKGGNLFGYEENLVDVYGKEKFEIIKCDIVREWQYLGLDKNKIRETIPIARQIVKELKELNLIYTNAMRWKRRLNYNKRLGIYE